MKKQFWILFGHSFSVILQTLILILFCAGISAAVVWPLWKFAVTTPVFYTISVLAVAATLLVFSIIRTVRRSPILKTLSLLFHIIIIATGIFGAIQLVFSGHRLISILVLVLIPVLCIICTFLFAQKKQ
jgi:hypothetical protein